MFEKYLEMVYLILLDGCEKVKVLYIILFNLFNDDV